MPTYNSERTLKDSLDSIFAQEYDACVNVILVDGGSSDSTQEIAQGFGIRPFVNPGQYVSLLNGANNFGIAKAPDNFIMLIDSDNILVERDFLSNLINPLLIDKSINLSFPLVRPEKTKSSLNNWLNSLEEELEIKQMLSGFSNEGYYLVERAYYGLPNVNLVRKNVWRAVGGYDQDWRVMRRLYDLNLSKTAIVENCRFFHRSVIDPISFLQKWYSRMIYYSHIGDDDLEKLRVPMTSLTKHPVLKDSLLEFLPSSLKKLITTRDLMWGWGLIYPLLGTLLFLRNPMLFKRSIKNW